jgi:hypothetical protein
MTTTAAAMRRSHSDFDGLGHYRQSVTGGSFEQGNVRTTFTHYNSAAGTFELDANGQVKPTFHLPPTNGPWILTDYDVQRVTKVAGYPRRSSVSTVPRDR